jgi:hypothetical protein
MATALADRWVVFGTEIPNPAHIRDARFAGAVYACRAAEARAVMRGTGLEPVTAGGRAFSALACIQYIDTDLGPYDEIALQLLVRGPGGKIGMYTAELPVTGEFTLHAGRQIWGLPKWRARTESTFDGRGVRLKLWDGDTRVLAVALDGGPIAAPTAMPIPLPVWSVRVDGPNQGELLHGPFPLRAEGFRIRPGGARVALGEHRMSELARRLGMTGSALYTMSARKISGSLGNFDVVG